MRGSPADLLPMLARREQLLAVLQDEARTKSDLSSVLDISRSTVDRSVRELETQGVIERRDGGFGLSLCGRLLFEEFRQFRERSDDIAAADDLLTVLGPETDIDAAMLADAEVVAADRTTPYRPAERFLDRICEANAVDILSTAIGPKYVDVVHEQVVDEGLEYTVGATATVVERLVSEYASELREALSTDRMTLRELDDAPPFSVAVLDSSAGRAASVLVYGNEGVRGFIDNDSRAAVEWAEGFVRRYWRDGTAITVPVTDR